MSLEGSAEAIVMPTLRGKISTIIEIDTTLTKGGAAADAKATGDAIREMLGMVDNDAEQAATAALNKANTAISTAESAMSKAEAAQNTANSVSATANAAKTIAESTQEYVDQLKMVKTVNGISPDDYGNVTLPSADGVSY